MNIEKTPGLRVLHTDCFIDKYRHHHVNRTFHKHNCIEMAYVLSGTATHNLQTPNGQIEICETAAGDYIFIDYNVFHGFQNESGDFSIINLLFQPTLLDKSFGKASSFENIAKHQLIGFDYKMLNSSPVNIFFKDKNEKILELFEKAFSVFNRKISGNNELMRCYVIEIIILTLQNLLLNKPARKKSSTITEICDYISVNYVENLSLTQICKDRYFSIPYISKKFKDTCGISFEKYLMQIRIHNACNLLLETNLPINIISAQVGYNDINSFRTTFKKLTGKTPSEFKKIYNSNNY